MQNKELKAGAAADKRTAADLSTSASLEQNGMLGGVYFSREIFIETIEALKYQYEHDKKCSDAFQTILPADFVSSYDNHWVNNQLVKLMQLAMNDNHKDSWIEYYLFELDFGEKYHEGCATNKDGSPIDLSNAGSLWDFLNCAQRSARLAKAGNKCSSVDLLTNAQK